jgi:signal transduction histidine kinase
VRAPIAAFRTILLGVCAVLASIPDAEHEALIPLAALWIVSWIVFRAPLRLTTRIWIAYGEAAATGVFIAVSGGSHSPLLPYLLSSGLALGLLAGPRAVAEGALVATLALGSVHELVGRDDDVQTFVVTAGQWLLLGAAVGLIATWARNLAAAADVSIAGYEQARGLLEQLRTVTRGLPGGLDAGAAAEGLLAEAARLAPSSRSGVLVQTGAAGALIPLAVRGVRRVPWRAPLTEPGPLRAAWESQEAVVDRRAADVGGRRRGGVLAVVPLCGSSSPFGLLVMETQREGAFDDEEISAVTSAVRAVALRLETSLLFEEVRSVASAEERNRLAREMHDGVAQDLAFIGYRLDALRTRAGQSDPEFADTIAALRKEITELISNLRLSITDLRTSVTSDRGLGAALSSYVRAVAQGRRLTVHLSLQESAFRLPPDREVALFRIAQLVAQDVRETSHVNDLWVTLRVDPPFARLTVEHDGRVEDSGHDLTAAAAVLEALGGSLQIGPRNGGGVRIDALFEGDDDDDQRPAG